jgi:hypothetical protein
MRRLLLGLALVGAFVAGGLLMNGMFVQADDKTEPKVRGTLYPNWKRLGLTEEQTQKIYKIQGNYRGQIDKLEAQIRDLKKKERSEAELVLTAAQKQRLKELGSGEPDKDKKTDAAKPADKAPDKSTEKKPN